MEIQIDEEAVRAKAEQLKIPPDLFLASARLEAWLLQFHRDAPKGFDLEAALMGYIVVRAIQNGVSKEQIMNRTGALVDDAIQKVKAGGG